MKIKPIIKTKTQENYGYLFHCLTLVAAGYNQELEWITDPDDRKDGLNKDIENTTCQNPYYEGDVELCSEVTSKSQIVPNWNETEVVTSTKNIYYEI